jgi:hypothetical protein
MATLYEQLRIAERAALPPHEITPRIDALLQEYSTNPFVDCRGPPQSGRSQLESMMFSVSHLIDGRFPYREGCNDSLAALEQVVGPVPRELRAAPWASAEDVLLGTLAAVFVGVAYGSAGAPQHPMEGALVGSLAMYVVTLIAGGTIALAAASRVAYQRGRLERRLRYVSRVIAQARRASDVPLCPLPTKLKQPCPGAP